MGYGRASGGCGTVTVVGSGVSGGGKDFINFLFLFYNFVL